MAECDADQHPDVLQVETSHIVCQSENWGRVAFTSVCHSRRRGEGEVQVPLGGRGHDDRAHLHLGLLAHEPFGVAGEADQVPLACHLK